MRLSKRLELVASFVEKDSRVADVGTDHGYIPIYLAEIGTAKSAVAMDLREGPLQRAREHIRDAGLSGRIETRISDGLSALGHGEADTVVIAGMGGGLIIHILEDGRRLWKEIKRFVLSPQSDLEQVRRYLEANGFLIEKEAMTQEDGKYYTVMAARLSGGKKAEDIQEEAHSVRRQAELRYGRRLIQSQDPVLAAYLKKEEARIRSVLDRLKQEENQNSLSESGRRAAKQLEEDLAVLYQAQKEMQEVQDGKDLD